MSNNQSVIVPVYNTNLTQAPATAPSNLVYNNGPLLANVQVYTLFWGSAWGGSQSLLVSQLNGFFQYILTSPLMSVLAQYSVPAYQIGNGSWTGTYSLTSSEPGGGSGTVTDAQIQAQLQALITAGTLPQPNANSLYFIYLPPGVVVSALGGSSCSLFCGYHSCMGTATYYAVMPYPCSNGCTGGLTDFAALTSISSHELCEAITDPQPGTGWVNQQGQEIGDICAWQTGVLGGYTVQEEWSNSAGACVISSLPSIYCFHQGSGNISQLWYNTLNGNYWAGDQQVPNTGISYGPSAVLFNNMIYCFHEGNSYDNTLWYNVYNGQGWLGDTQVPNTCTSFRPSAVVFNNLLYVFHEGNDNDNTLWYNVFNGSSWAGDVQVPNTCISFGPSAVVVGGSIWCFHQGNDNDNTLWYNVFNGSSWAGDVQVPNTCISDGPSAVVFNGGIYCFHQGNDNDNSLWYNVLAGMGWVGDTQVPNTSMGAGPSAITTNGLIYVFHQGYNSNGQLWYNTFDGSSWAGDINVPNTGMSDGPSAVVVPF